MSTPVWKYRSQTTTTCPPYEPVLENRPLTNYQGMTGIFSHLSLHPLVPSQSNYFFLVYIHCSHLQWPNFLANWPRCIRRVGAREPTSHAEEEEIHGMEHLSCHLSEIEFSRRAPPPFIFSFNPLRMIIVDFFHLSTDESYLISMTISLNKMALKHS